MRAEVVPGFIVFAPILAATQTVPSAVSSNGAPRARPPPARSQAEGKGKELGPVNGRNSLKPWPFSLRLFAV